ncbi:hypothetical protein DIPPA_16274 [Diplonema papillatum]|nr:hypothetical protein DIPPA_16274 [Diplonema papillatum]
MKQGVSSPALPEFSAAWQSGAKGLLMRPTSACGDDLQTRLLRLTERLRIEMLKKGTAYDPQTMELAMTVPSDPSMASLQAIIAQLKRSVARLEQKVDKQKKVC